MASKNKDKLKEILGKIALSTNTITVEDDINHYTVLELLNALRSNVKEINKILDNLDGEVKEEVQRLIDNGTLGRLINEELLGEIDSKVDALDEKQTQTNAQISQIKKDNNSIEYYPRLEGEIDDYRRFLRAIRETPSNGVLHIPSGSYQIDNYLVLTKGITLQGDGMNSTHIYGNGLKIESSNVTINDLDMNCPKKANGFQCNEGSFSNIRINRCRSVARDHAFLFESYYGIVQNVVIQDCVSDGSVHGFISKAYDVKFINCKANNHTGFAFGMISDNIPGVTNVAEAYFNVIENCSAYNCGAGVRSYCRDKWQQTCVPRCYNNVINGFTALSCDFPISIGEESVPDDYQSIYRIEYTTVIGVQDFGTKQGAYSVKLAGTYRCILDNCTLIYDVRQLENARDNVIGNIVTKRVITPNTSAIPINSPTSYEVNTSLNSSIELYLEGNSADSSVVKLVGTPKNGNIITVLVRNAGRGTFGGFDTTNTIVDTSKYNILKTGITFNYGQVTQWMWVVGIEKWVCIYASDLINLA